MFAFKGDSKLPSLPVPELDETCSYLKKMIEPLIEPEIFEEHTKAIDAFETNEAPQLHKLLRQFADSDAYNSSWLRPIWDDMYLTIRDMPAVNVNFTFQFLKDFWGKNDLPAFVSILSQAIAKLRAGKLKPEPCRDGQLSMDSTAYMIYTRIPGRVRDNMYHTPHTLPMTASVVCRGQWFIMTLTDKDANILSAASIEAALSSIRNQALSLDKRVPVGAISCSERVIAAMLREELQFCPQNRMNLERIEKSIFTVCLDEALSEGEEFNLRLITGEAENRWFDKNLQIISDGYNLGGSFEHSGCDASAWVYLLNEASKLRDASDDFADAEVHILPLSWNIPEALYGKLKTQISNYESVKKRLSLSDRRCANISKGKIKSLKCSPDAFVQLLYQGAYYKQTGRFASIYGSVSARSFFQGRTECYHLVSSESADLVRSVLRGDDKGVLTKKFKLVLDIIKNNVNRAQLGLGPERHMTGLSMMAQIHGIKMPDIFLSAGYKALISNTVSTSNTTAPCIDFFSFGPVSADGIGIGYGIKDEALHVAVCAYDESGIDPKQFIDDMEFFAKTFEEVLTK